MGFNGNPCGIVMGFMLALGKFHLEMDDDWGYPSFRKPLYHQCMEFYIVGITIWSISIAISIFSGNRIGIELDISPNILWVEELLHQLIGGVSYYF